MENEIVNIRILKFLHNLNIEKCILCEFEDPVTQVQDACTATFKWSSLKNDSGMLYFCVE